MSAELFFIGDKGHRTIYAQAIMAKIKLQQSLPADEGTK